MVSPISDTETGVPIPSVDTSERQPRRRGSRVLQSSLDIAFSYSRSQQRHYGNIQSAPSFVDASTRSWSSNEPVDEDANENENEEEDNVDDEEEELEGPRRRSDSISPSIFPSDPDPFQRTKISPPTNPAVETTPKAGSVSLLKTTSNSRSNRSSSLISSKTRLDSPGASNVYQPTGDRSTERTPLLGPGTGTGTKVDPDGIGVGVGGTPDMGRRRSSTATAIKRRKANEVGQSTNGQTLFNAIAVLVGIGLLSLPLAFAYAGWLGGTVLLFGFAYVTCHTAKLLARLILTDRTLLGYTDIGKRAFGGWASSAINVFVALVVLFGDTLSVIFPSMSSNTFKAIGFIIILPTTLLPLHLLSLPSLLSTLSSLLLIIILITDGLLAGSLTNPAPTNWTPEWKGGNWLGGVGLVLAGFGGHAVVPGLARDMKHPKDFARVINRACVIATIISFIAGSAGYLMIGNSVSDEITRDLLEPKYHYPRSINLVALWMIVINPITKFGLCTRPLNITIESILSIQPRLPGDESQILTSPMLNPHLNSNSDTEELESKLRRREKRNLVLRVISRIVITGVCTITAILLPGFGKVMAFLGSFSAFLICIILPLLFYLRLAPKMLGDTNPFTRFIHWIMVIISVILMIGGTTWAFIPGSGHGGLDDSR